MTEELARRLALLPEGTAALGKAPWPAAGAGPGTSEAAAEIRLLQDVVSAVRNLRAEVRVSEAAEVEVRVKAPAAASASLHRQQAGVRRLSKASSFEAGPATSRPPQSAVAHLPGDVEVFVLLSGLIDLDAEKSRLAKEIEKQEGFLAAADRKLGNADFASRAKPEVVEAEKARREETSALVKRLRESLAALG